MIPPELPSVRSCHFGARDHRRPSKKRTAILVLETAGNGGTEVYVEGLARYLTSHMNVLIACLRGDLPTAHARFPELNVALLPDLDALRALVQSNLGAVFNLHLYSSLLPAVRALRKAGKSPVTTLHQPLEPWNPLHRMRWRMAVAQSAAVIGVSTACLEGYGPFLRGRDTAAIPGALAVQFLPPPRVPTQHDPMGRFDVLFAGRLSKEKNLHLLIQAVARLPSTRLTLIGDGPERTRLVGEARDRNADALFTGRLPRREVFDHLKRADAFVLPSRFEGLGLAALEAMALGVPTITADFAASRDYIRAGVTGLTFARGDADDLTRTLDRLRGDPNLRIEMSRRGAKFVRSHFVADIQYAKYLPILAAH